MSKVVTRSQWGARTPGPMSSQGPPTEAFIHYLGDGRTSSVDTLAEQKAAMRSIQAFHMGPERGWSDIGYHYMVFQPYGDQDRARAFAGRSHRNIPAAQGGHNTGTLAVCVYAGNGEPLKRNTRYVIEQVLSRHPSLVTLGGHRDVTSTSCPGDAIYGQLGRIAAAAGLKRFDK